jgi:nucleoside phosphorylase
MIVSLRFLPDNARGPLRDTVRAVILVVAATPFEAALADGHPVETVACGIGPVEAALATAHALAKARPDVLVHVGIAGAQTLPNGALALGSEAVYCDVLDPNARIPRVERVRPDAALLEVARRALPEAHVLPIGTSAHVGGGTGCEVEAMEGFGVLRAAQLAGVPAVELRAISNAVAETDRDRWSIDGALQALGAGIDALLGALERA